VSSASCAKRVTRSFGSWGSSQSCAHIACFISSMPRIAHDFDFQEELFEAEHCEKVDGAD
jgi:hypothetical protein